MQEALGSSLSTGEEIKAGVLVYTVNPHSEVEATLVYRVSSKPPELQSFTSKTNQPNKEQTGQCIKEWYINLTT